MTTTVESLPYEVARQLKAVRYNSSGDAQFATQAEADAFIEAVYKRYPCEGYGTSCYVLPPPSTVTVRWSVWGCE